MSNIHGIHEFRNRGSDQQQRVYLARGATHFPADEGPTISLMGAPSNQPVPPISEKLMPRFNVRTVTFILSMIQIAMFIATLVVGQVMFDGAFVKGNIMLGPSTTTLRYMGGKYLPDIRNGAVWRLLTPALLHGGVIHIVSNLFFQFRFGFTLEKRWGIKMFCILYTITAIGASFFSCVMSPYTVSVGASGALFGLLGADAAFLAINWDEIMDNKSEAMMLGCMIILNLLIGFGGEGIDNWAHFGGMLTGVFFAVMALPHVTQRVKENVIRGIGGFLLFGWFLMCILVVFVGNQ